MKAIIGLGNPGPEYQSTRHNAGFAVLDKLVGTVSGALFCNKSRLLSQIASITVSGEEILLVKPSTYMNLSGQAVCRVINWYKIPVCQLLVVHDDVSLPLGKLRFQKNGGAGGQHGIESIMECLGTRPEFDRLKLGIGPDPGGQARASYVLSAMPAEDQALFHRCITLATQAIGFWVKEGTDKAMNQYNGLQLNR
ncbi:MAG: aminoacyl-tRNA hydrolase [Candidatus Melainabacteria bacterium]|nr:aminoacyl-tRNA hydrolase [Candidatus Melainabacteria bacterium]